MTSTDRPHAAAAGNRATTATPITRTEKATLNRSASAPNETAAARGSFSNSDWSVLPAGTERGFVLARSP